MILEPGVFVHPVYPVVVGWIIRLYGEGQDDVFAVSILADVLQQCMPVALAAHALNYRYAIDVDHREIRFENYLELGEDRLVYPRHKKCHGVDGFKLPKYVRLFQPYSHPR